MMWLRIAAMLVGWALIALILWDGSRGHKLTAEQWGIAGLLFLILTVNPWIV